MTSIDRGKWWKIQWFADDDTEEEKRLLIKLDVLIIPYLVLSYWVKNLDQNNLNNAYVAGMKEELGLHGDNLVQLQTMYTVGAVVGQIPFLFLFTYLPMHWTLPALDVLWGVFTLLQYRAQSRSEMMAYRFLVGWFEAAYFPGVHWVLGSWYRKHEIARRGGIWYIGLPIGTLTAGFVQSGATTGLTGKNGLSGWRWMYIICAVITIPIGLLGLVALPGTVDRPNRLILNQHDIEVSRRRLERDGHKTQGKLRWHHIKEVFLSKYFYVVVLVDCLFWNHSVNGSAMLLWLKSLGRYSSAKVNQYGSIPSGLGIFYTLLTNFSSDLLWGPAWGITFAATMNGIAMAILTAWHVPESALWYAFCTTSFSYSLSSSLYGWINNILRDSPETRSFTLVFVNILAQSSTAWIPLLTYPTHQAPRYKRGYAYSLSCACLLIAFTHLLKFVIDAREKQKAARTQEADEAQDSSEPSVVQANHNEDSSEETASTKKQ